MAAPVREWTPSSYFRAAAAAAVPPAQRRPHDVPPPVQTPAADDSDATMGSVREVEDGDDEPYYAVIVLNQPLVAGFRDLWRRGTCARAGGAAPSIQPVAQ